MRDDSVSVRVVIVDDHKICQFGLRSMLQAHPDLSVVGGAETARAALELVASEKPDVVTLDIRIQHESGLLLLPKLLEASPSTRVLVLSVHEDQETLREALARGAHGYVNKAAEADEIIGAVRSVARGRSFWSVPFEPGPPLPSPEQEGGSLRPSARPLSERERQVLQLYAGGHTQRQIADRLGLRLKTIETYRSRLGDKFGVRSREQLVDCARQLGLVDGTHPALR
jgi:two-component system, NarL family, response regulator NreC